VSGDRNIDELNNKQFQRTFLSLLNVIQKRDSKKRKKEARNSNAKRVRADSRPITPHQSTSVDPSFSGSTSESMDEASTQTLLSNFVVDVMGVLQSEIRQLGWLAEHTNCIVELNKTFELFQQS